ncbi:UvrD-helicase domain-containing protein [Nocardia asteroides]|uniref:UvrD-helicase domain-containing protein n=1 Tax=Nocardia asteroides TaxID=1824 RepID=UPI001E3F9ABF|nr:UvrD-helicase domain-containing protein [Nocardia asteroides]UGT62118.1 AAA family ATPase [Nocardia asteroides]
MSSRLSAKDTDADRQLREVLDGAPARGFVMIAGAGSGKTTSLVKALGHVVRTRGQQLRSRTQQIACITYTAVAAEEIAADVGYNPIVTVSTIHSFLWTLVRPFNHDIRVWLEQELHRKIETMTAKQAAYTLRTRQTTRARDDEEMRRLRRQVGALASVESFRYGHGTDHSTGSLGHEEVVKLATQLIIDKPMLARIAARKYPYIFVDESQDTFPEVVTALKHIYAQARGEVCLGFFGDPMQQIYQRGVGTVTIEPGWATIEKAENFRSSLQVLRIVNQVRSKADGLVQVPGRPDGTQREGEFHVFVLPADEHRTANLNLVREWLSRHSSAGDWTTDPDVDGRAAKILIIMHRMAAARLGFAALFAAFNDNDESTLKAAFNSGNARPLQVFDELILPLCEPAGADDPAVIALVRDKLVRELTSGTDARGALAGTRTQVEKIRSLVSEGGPNSVGAVLRLAMESSLYEPDPKLAVMLNRALGGELTDADTGDPESAALKAYLACDVREVSRYFYYIREQSPYSTQHGTKGSEFAKVLVILDDQEGAPFKQYSYEKLFGIKALSDRDLARRAANEDSVLERTRRLLYVCVSRAVESLAIVIFAHDTEAARAALVSELLFDRPALTLAELSNEELLAELGIRAATEAV